MAEGMAVSYESKRCNIVMLGVAGSGKSTLGNKILRHQCFKVDSNKSAVSVTEVVSSGERVIEGPDKVMYSVKMVDTMGFADPRRDSDDTIKAIRKFFREEVVEGISLVLFVMKEGRVTTEVVDTVNLIKDHFKEISPMSALVITHCEPLTDKARETILAEYKTSSNKDVSAMRRFMQKGVYTVGFPDLSDTKEGLREVFQQGMDADVQAIHNVIYESTEMMLTSEKLFDEKFWTQVKQSSALFSPAESTPSTQPEPESKSTQPEPESKSTQPEPESKNVCIIL